MRRDGRQRRRTTASSNNLENSTTTVDFVSALIHNDEDNVDIDSILLKRLLKHEMLHGSHSTSEDFYPYKSSYNNVEESSTETSSSTSSTTTVKHRQKNRGRFIYAENFDPQDISVGLVEHPLPPIEDDYRPHPRYPNTHGDVPQPPPRNWHDAHPHKDNSYWSLRIFVMGVFFTGLIFLFIFSHMRASRRSRRPLQTNPRPARARRGGSGGAGGGRTREDDEDGGFTTDNRRRIAHAGSRASTPPRLVTPPPPYPGSPTAPPLPAAAVYVNPLDKPHLPSGSRETSTIQMEEQPPPYPG